MVVVEVCVESLAGVRLAREAGAQRVELCSALGEGGLTPSAGLLEEAVALGGIEVVVLVRPRGGDFLYSSEELRVLERDVVLARERGAAGVAVGCLTADGALDEARCARLIELAHPLPLVFHRAFDLLREPRAALETLIRLGAARILTSGQAPSAREGTERLQSWVAATRGRLEIVAAGGIRAENVAAILDAGVEAVHFSASTRRASAMAHRVPEVRLAVARSPENYAHHETDGALVRDLMAALASRGST